MFKNKKILSALLVLFLSIGFSLNARVVLNDSPVGFAPPPTESQSSLSEYIVEGANNFFTSYQSYISFLQKIEQADPSNFDYQQMGALLKDSITANELTKASYSNLISQSEKLEYAPAVISELKIFDFDTFETEYNLVHSIFKETQAYLTKGDIKGIYNYMAGSVQGIGDSLEKVRLSVDSGIFPDMKLVRKINQKYMTTLLFGQYVAEVFQQIKERL